MKASSKHSGGRLVHREKGFRRTLSAERMPGVNWEVTPASFAESMTRSSFSNLMMPDFTFMLLSESCLPAAFTIVG